MAQDVCPQPMTTSATAPSHCELHVQHFG